VLTAKSSKPPFTSAARAPAEAAAPTPAPHPVVKEVEDDFSGPSHKAASVSQSGANLRIDVEHPFSAGKISLWVDGKLQYTQALHGEAKKKLIVFRKTEGHNFDKIQVPAGKHSIRVRVQSPEQYYDLASTITANLSDGSTQTLNVHCEEETVKLSVE